MGDLLHALTDLFDACEQVDKRGQLPSTNRQSSRIMTQILNRLTTVKKQLKHNPRDARERPL